MTKGEALTRPASGRAPSLEVAPCALRAATTADACALSALGIQVFLDTYATEGVRPDLAREAFATCGPRAVRLRLRDAHRQTLVATRGEALLGFAEWVTAARAAPDAAVTGAELARLYVQRACHGTGIGRALLQAAEQLASEAGHPHLWLTAWEGNTHALGFYAHTGYLPVGRTMHVIEGRAYGNVVLARSLQAG